MELASHVSDGQNLIRLREKNSQESVTHFYDSLYHHGVYITIVLYLKVHDETLRKHVPVFMYIVWKCLIFQLFLDVCNSKL